MRIRFCYTAYVAYWQIVLQKYFEHFGEKY